MIRSSKHSLKFANKRKLEDLSWFVDEYRRCASIIMDYLWTHEYVWTIKDRIYVMDIKNNKLDCPLFVSVDIINQCNLNTILTSRALKLCSTQVCGMISAEITKQKKRLFTLHKLKEEGIPRSRIKNFIKTIKQNIPVKPNCSNINPEINSLCSNIQYTNGEFDAFVKLTSITKTKLTIILPIKFHKHSNKLKDSSIKLCSSMLVTKKYIYLRYELETPIRKTIGDVVGADQGLKDVLVLSNGDKTPRVNNHGYNLELIMKKLSTKKLGSKSFKRSQIHRINFINWSINNMNFSNIKEVRLEKIYNMNYKRNTSRFMKHWSNPLIRDKVQSLCELLGVHVIEQSCTYRSQRCSGCGLVRKSNRKGKIYKCESCRLEIDADLNAACNHEIDLPEIPSNLRKRNMNKTGFFWKKSGFYLYNSSRSLQSLLLVDDKLIEFI